MSRLSDTETTESSDSYEIGGKVIIPDGTEVLANISSAAWAVNSGMKEKYALEGENYIKIDFHVVEGEYKDEVVSKKVFANAPDKEIRKKANKFIVALDNLCSRKLIKADEDGIEWDDGVIGRSLLGHAITIKIRVFAPEGSDDKFNWIQKISAPPKKIIEEDARIIEQANNIDDEVPF